MARLLLEHGADYHMGVGSLPLAIALFVSVSVLVALCAKHSRKHPETSNNKSLSNFLGTPTPTPTPTNNKTPLASPKKLVARISNKAIDPFKKSDHGTETEAKEMEGDGFGEGGLWQKSIMMGDKCRPPEFSGVIYYDSHGNQLSEMPRSPRATPLPTFSFPLVK